ncbi:hypothetical protein [Paenibacillus sp. UNC451MF]|uniref:hypothetical protein n=1 Tax=Paenibacillus sp. UNC451MF TaxID=1449063 RepID=UPI00048B78CC|nr:hypothetical protein [Paenibacillus sp. UNC451MF]
MVEDHDVVRLDDFYAMKVHTGGKGGVSGEIIRLSVDPQHPATHLFDSPVYADIQDLRDWAVRALQAYREG